MDLDRSRQGTPAASKSQQETRTMCGVWQDHHAGQSWQGPGCVPASDTLRPPANAQVTMMQGWSLPREQGYSTPRACGFPWFPFQERDKGDAISVPRAGEPGQLSGLEAKLTRMVRISLFSTTPDPIPCELWTPEELPHQPAHPLAQMMDTSGTEERGCDALRGQSNNY